MIMALEISILMAAKEIMILLVSIWRMVLETIANMMEEVFVLAECTWNQKNSVPINQLK